MLQPEKLFTNLFEDRNIIPSRLSNFTSDAIVRFNQLDTDGHFTASTAAIVAAYTPFYKGLSTIDTSLATKKGITMTVNEVKDGFGSFMGDYESEIARALGGKGTPAYIAFYPRGVTEFSTASITQMPILVQRIYKLATNNAAALGATLTPLLQAFSDEWQAAIDGQSTVKGDLSEGRASRDTLRHNVELALMAAVHLVGNKFPGDVAKCMSFFDFNLLTGVSHKAQPVTATPILP